MKLVRFFLIIIVLFSVLNFLVVQKAFADPCTISNGPDLYQINRTSTQATLFFTPINDQIQSYTIIYGFSPGDEKYSTTFSYGASTGAISYTIAALDPNFQYYFKVMANTSCTSSPWSSWVGDKHTSSSLSSQSSSVSAGASSLPPPGSNTVMIAFLISLGLILSGLTLFKFSTSLS